MSDLDDRKEILKEAFNKSFVDDYEVYKSIILKINAEFKELDIDYEFTYDEFCVDFLNETLENLKKIDVFEYETFQEFYSNFWDFNLYVIRMVLKNKIEKLGYDFEEFQRKLNTKSYLKEFSSN
jgi:hypothetical protein